jgi:hypothetical protein
MRTLLYFSVFALLAAGCRKDNGERLFEMVFPNIVFEIPAGLNANFQQVFEIPVVFTNIDTYLAENGTDTALIRAISPFSARITSLEGSAFDYDFVEAVSIRICPSTRGSCFDGEEVFYIDDLRGRAGQDIRLIPGLRNAKRDLVLPQFRLEVVFLFAYTTPYAVRSRLQMGFEAVK